MATYTVPAAVGRQFNREFFHRHWTVIVCILVAFLVVLTFLYYVTSYQRSAAATFTDKPDWFGGTRSSLAFNYQQCPPVKEEKINIHVLAHSHDDVAWLKTFDQYYYGTLLERQNCGVQFILDSVVDQLLLDENRRFVYVEIAFFWRWWNEQTEERKGQVKRLVRRGQLEFAGGGWSMNDEASTNYLSIIDNFSWGFRKLKEMFGDADESGARPKVGWQIDPFGHSREQASIFAQLGFDGVFLNRIDYQDKAQRMKTKKAEFIWETSPNIGSWADIFSVVLYNHYSPVEGFHYGYHRKNDAVVDDPNSQEYNVDVMVGRILNEASIRSQLYNTNHIFITWGDDFTFQNANVWFKNIDKIIKHINEGKLGDSSKYNIFYSTPSCFVKCVNDAVKQKQLMLTTKRGDFFPYAMSGHAYWTGYYTSRPTLKYALNLANRFLQVSKQLMVLSGTDEKHNNGSLDELRSTIALMQHHDAITGTSQQHVVDDYKLRMTDSLRQSAITVDNAIKKVLSKNERRPDEAGEETEKKRGEIKFDSCHRADDLSECNISESGKPFVVTVYNPSSRPVTHYVRLPVAGDEGQLSYSVLNPQGEREQVQLVPIAEPVRRVAGRSSSSTYEIVFRADEIPPLGMRSYYVAPSNADDQVHRSRELPSNGLSSYTIGDIKRTSITLDGSNSSISSCTIKGVVYRLQQSYLYYLSKNRPRGGKPSGAYVFNPENKEPFPVTRFKPLIKIYAGLHVDEVHMEYTEWVSQVVRIYKEEDHIEFNWLIGPLGVMRDYSAKEVIVRYKIPDLNTDGTFYTDSNGREMMKRVRNKRDTWKVDMGASTASGNYYPVTCRISVSSGQTQMSIVVDRPEGGTSLTNGEIELMIHRESAYDDELGMGEPLTDVERDQYRTEIRVRGRHYLTVGNDRQKQNADDRILVDKKHNSVWTFVTALPDHLSFARWNELFKMEYFGLKRDYVGSMPDNIRIITLEPWSGGQFLLRLEHFMEKTDNVSSTEEPTVVNIDDLFRPFKITAMKEMCLAGDISKSELNRLKWMSSSSQSIADQTTTDWRHIELNAMQIRTFLVSVKFSDL